MATDLVDSAHDEALANTDDKALETTDFSRMQVDGQIRQIEFAVGAELAQAVSRIREQLLHRERSLESCLLRNGREAPDLAWTKASIEDFCRALACLPSKLSFSAETREGKLVVAAKSGDKPLDELFGHESNARLLEYFDHLDTRISKIEGLEEKIAAAVMHLENDRKRLSDVQALLSLAGAGGDHSGTALPESSTLLAKASRLNEAIANSTSHLEERREQLNEKLDSLIAFTRHWRAQSDQLKPTKTENTAASHDLGSLSQKIRLELDAIVIPERSVALPRPRRRFGRFRQRGVPGPAQSRILPRLLGAAGLAAVLSTAVFVLANRQRNDGPALHRQPLPLSSQYLEHPFLQRYFTSEQRNRVAAARDVDELIRITKEESARADFHRLNSDIWKIVTAPNMLFVKGDLVTRVVRLTASEAMLAGFRGLFGSFVAVGFDYTDSKGKSVVTSRMPASESGPTRGRMAVDVPLDAFCSQGQVRFVIDLVLPNQAITMTSLPRADLMAPAQKLGLCK